MLNVQILFRRSLSSRLWCSRASQAAELPCLCTQKGESRSAALHSSFLEQDVTGIPSVRAHLMEHGIRFRGEEQVVTEGHKLHMEDRVL